MNKSILGLVLAFSLLALPVSVKADGEVLSETTEEICVQTTVYGGGVGVVCSAKTHEPVDTGVEDFLPVIAGGLFSLSFVSFRVAKKNRQVASLS